MTQGEQKYLIESLCADVAMKIVEDYDVSLLEALDILYGSVTFGMIQDIETGLYFQSPGYVYSFIKEELTKGTFLETVPTLRSKITSL